MHSKSFRRLTTLPSFKGAADHNKLWVLAGFAGLLLSTILIGWLTANGMGTLLIGAAMIVPALMLSLWVVRKRALFPYVLVFFLASEYLSPEEGAGIITIPKVGLAALLLAHLMTTRERLTLKSNVIFLPAMLFVGYFAASILWSGRADSALTRLITLALLLVAFWLVVHSCKDVDDLWHFLGATVAVSLLTAVLAVNEVVGLRAFGVDILQVTRAGSLQVNANGSAYYISVGMGVLLAAHVYRVRTWKWLPEALRLPALLVCAAGILATGSRGGLAAAAAGILAVAFMALLQRKLSLRFVILLTLGVVGLFAANQYLPLIDSFWMARVVIPLESGRDITANRTTIWTDAWSAFTENPEFGMGLEGYRYGAGHAIHNTYLWTITNGGIIGGGLTILILVTSAGTILHVWRRSRLWGLESLEAAAVAVAAAASATAVFAFGSTAQYNKLLWLVLSLVQVLAVVLATAQEQARTSAETPAAKADLALPVLPRVAPSTTISHSQGGQT